MKFSVSVFGAEEGWICVPLHYDTRIFAAPRRHMPTYEICETFASGSTSKIKRGLDPRRRKIAIKVISKTFRSRQDIEKETRIHKSLSHPNILKFIDSYEDGSNFYIVMCLAPRDLMDFVEIDNGIAQVLAHFYFKQLISALRYLHSKGVCHRDIKADNILIDYRGNLLLADFGFATLHTYRGKKRVLKSLAGSYMYMAPEVLEARYEGDKVDIWSAGIVLLIMYAGCFPWDEPSMQDQRFEAYVQLKYHNYSPFNRVPFNVLKLIKSMLAVDSACRASIESIERDGWFSETSSLMNEKGLCEDYSKIAKYLSTGKAETVFSQPDTVRCNLKADIILSQPMVVNSLPCLRRIYVFSSTRRVVKRIEELMRENVVKYTFEERVFSFLTSYGKGTTLLGNIGVESVSDVCCVTFIKHRGCSFAFKKLVALLSEGVKSAFPK